MSQISLPENYAVLQDAHGAWYPVEIEREYGLHLPEEGRIHLHPSWPHGTYRPQPTQEDALVCCQQAARFKARREAQHYAEIAQQYELYPDRCVYYADLIEELTGDLPFIMFFGVTSVIMPLPSCTVCKHQPLNKVVKGETIDDTLATAAEWAYTFMTQPCCQCKGVRAHVQSA